MHNSKKIFRQAISYFNKDEGPFNASVSPRRYTYQKFNIYNNIIKLYNLLILIL